MAQMSSLSSFLSAREALIDEERSIRRDHHADVRPISTEEKAADKILRAIRSEEAKGLWKEHHDLAHRFNEVYPGMGFLTCEYGLMARQVFGGMWVLSELTLDTWDL